ncbi:MAG: hypothetical protein K0V04_15680, partial [Deltaproteobacteria bacterium]|nr:hypothetical protein [Deltaproteobacteria bacterium]
MHNELDTSLFRQLRWILTLGALTLGACSSEPQWPGESDDRLIGGGFHKECTAHNQCTVLPGLGPDRCTDDDACGNVRLGCLSGACELLPSQGPDLCGPMGASPECAGHHLACAVNEDGEGPGCNLVEGVGPSTCYNDWDCAINTFSCQQGQCVHIPGAYAPRCSSDTECTDHHLGCDRISCVLLDGAGANTCLEDKDCAAVTLCVGGACVAIQESDANLEGQRQCHYDYDCTDAHMECSPNMCAITPGAGDNQCTRSRDCETTATVATCIAQACVEIDVDAAPEGNHCQNDAECVDRHMACDDRACVIQPNTPDGPNDDECGIDKDCTGMHNACVGGQCLSISGGGTDACSADPDCLDKHMACAGDACVLTDGFGPNECTSQQQCHTGFTCQGEACIRMIGSHFSQCSTHTECQGKHSACIGPSQCGLVDGLASDECTENSDCQGGSKCFG